MPQHGEKSVHLPPPKHPVFLCVKAHHLGHEQIVTQLPHGRHAGFRGVMAAGGDERTYCPPEHSAKELDPKAISHLID